MTKRKNKPMCAHAAISKAKDEITSAHQTIHQDGSSFAPSHKKNNLLAHKVIRSNHLFKKDLGIKTDQII